MAKQQLLDNSLSTVTWLLKSSVILNKALVPVAKQKIECTLTYAANNDQFQHWNAFLNAHFTKLRWKRPRCPSSFVLTHADTQTHTQTRTHKRTLHKTHHTFHPSACGWDQTRWCITMVLQDTHNLLCKNPFSPKFNFQGISTTRSGRGFMCLKML